MASTTVVSSVLVRLTSQKPTNESNWKVQYFDGLRAITSVSPTSARRVELAPGTHTITAHWTKTGRTTVITDAITIVVGRGPEIPPTNPPEVPPDVPQTPPAPTLTSVTPTTNEGSTAAVTLIGANFIVGATTVAVSGSGVTATNVVVNTATSISANLVIAGGAATGARNVTCTTVGGTSSARTFTVAAAAPSVPTLTSVTPATGVQGTTVPVTLVGTNFVADATTVAVSGSGVSVNTVVVGSGTSLTANVVIAAGAAATTRTVKVTTSAGTSGAQNFVVTASPAPPPGQKRVLSASDMTYLGCMRVPESGVNMMFSYGPMTGRKVDGQVRLLMIGSDGPAGDHCYELADTGSYNANPSAAPRMTLVRNWGDIYGGLRVSWNADGTSRTFPNTMSMSNFYFNEATQLLYWTYNSSYNVTAIQDWCLGATRLDATSGPIAFGPWRPTGSGGVQGTLKGPWRCLLVNRHPTSGELLCGSTLQSGNGYSPWGPDLWAGEFPVASTPSGYGTTDIALEKCLTYYPMVGNISTSGAFTGPLKAFRRSLGDYVFEPIPDITITEIDPLQNGGVGSWTCLDGNKSLAWIDLDNVHGVLFVSRMAAGHVWYRNAGGGHALCTHGLPSPVNITGPCSTAAYPAFIIYDPDVVDAVRAGELVDYTADPDSVIDVESNYGVVTAGLDQAGAGKALGGNYFDAETGKLYVSAPLVDTSTFGLINPIVHVFQIAD